MIHASGARLRAPYFGLAVLAVAASAMLAACGGGGSGGGDGGFSTPSSPSTSTNEPSSPTPSQPQPTAPPIVRTLAAGAELAPTLDAPQAGSTAATGDDKQGIYTNGFSGIAFVTPTGRFMYKENERWIFGGIDVNAGSWTFRSHTLTLSADGTLDSVTGSGDLRTKTSLSGTYSLGAGGTDVLAYMNYSAANALAVTQDAMAGTWSSTGSNGFNMSVTIDTHGNLTGTTTGTTLGTCALAGTLLQTEPTSSRNMFNVHFTATNAATGTDPVCDLDLVDAYDGLGGVLMVAVSAYPEEGVRRSFLFNAATANGALVTSNLHKR